MRWFQLSTSSEREHGDSSGNKTRSMVYLNVYDLTPINNYLYLFGFGIFHSGIEGSFFMSIFQLLSLVFSCIWLLWNLIVIYDVEKIN